METGVFCSTNGKFLLFDLLLTGGSMLLSDVRFCVLFCLRFSSRPIPDQIRRESRLSFQRESRLGKQWKSRKARGERRRTAGNIQGNPSLTRRESSDLCEHYHCWVSGTGGKQMSNTFFRALRVSLWFIETVG